MELTDEELIERARVGDETAFGFLVDKYKGAVHALAYRKLGDYHKAEDIAQDTFLRAYQKLSTLKDARNFAGWLYCITANFCRMYLRKRRREFSATIPLDQVAVEEWEKFAVERHNNFQERQSVHDAIAELPDGDRMVITLHYMGGMTIKEISRFLGTSAGAIKNRLYHARKHLKEELVKMMELEFSQNKLGAGFTVNLMEMLRSLKPIAPSNPTPDITRTIPWSIATAVTIITVGLSLLGGIMQPASHLSMVLEPGVSENGKQIQVVLMPSPMGTLDASEGQSGNQRMMLANMENAQHPLSGAIQAPEPTSSSVLAMQAKKENVNALASIAEEAKGKITVSGKVVKDDVPVKNAQIYLYNRDAKTVEQVSTTQAGGSFQFEMPKPSEGWNLKVLVYHPQYSLGWKSLSKEEDAEGMTIELHNAATITGTITNESGMPISSAEVQLRDLSSLNVREAISAGGVISAFRAKADEKGNFVLRNLQEGSNVRLYVLAPGYAREYRYNIQSGTKGLAFALKLGGRIEGQVTFGETGESAKNIGLHTQGLHPTAGWGETKTDKNGHYVFTNLPHGNYNVFIEDLPDWTAVAREYIEVAEGETVKNVDLKLVKGGFITGSVTDKDTDEPIPNCSIGFYDAARPESQAAMHSASTDESGYYRFRAAPGKALVYASYSPPKGYQSVGQSEKYVDVVEGETVSGVDFQFQKGIELTGTVVTFDGELVAGVEITGGHFDHPYATSDKNGRFTIAGLSPGQKLSLKAKQEKLHLRGRIDIEVQPGAEVELLLEEYETTSVSGRVVNPEGKPVAGANVSLMRRKASGGGVSSIATVTDGDGKFKIDELIIGNEYGVSAHAEGYRGAGTGMFTAEADMPQFEDIVLQELGRRYLEGKVTDTEGNPVVRARVMNGGKMTTTDAEGRYRLDNLVAAVEGRIDINHKDYGYSQFLYIPTNQTQNFVLVKADRFLAGKVLDADGNPIQGASVHVDSDDEASGHVNVGTSTNAQGEFRLRNLLDEKVPIYVGRGRLYKVFGDVETNQDDLIFVLKEEEQPPEPPKPLSEEEIAKREYRARARERLKSLEGNPAPELDVAQWLNCEPVKLAELKVEVVVLDFWTSKDVLCVEATRLMNALQKEYGPKGVVFIGIHEFPAKVDELKKFIQEKRITYKMAVDKQSPEIGANGMTFDKYGVVRFFKFIVINKEGVLHTEIWPHSLEGNIQELLSK